VIACLAVALPATAAQAAATSTTPPAKTSTATTSQSSTSSAAATCAASAQSQPFLKWGDSSSYGLVAGGDFEGSLSGWTLSHGAAQVTGSETYGVTGSVGKYSLALPSAGSSVQSPFTCVTASDPTFRFLARSEGTASSVTVAVAYQTPLGVIAVPVGTMTPGGSWQPAAAMPTGAAIAGALSANGTAQMALRFTALSGASRIDDVFVDPRMR
jgi:phosphoribosylcarboxyaminoimidazole (NCAIR) mutase